MQYTLTPQTAANDPYLQPAPAGAPPILDDLAVDMLFRAMDAGIGGADLKLFTRLLQIGCADRWEHHGAFGWFPVHAEYAAELCQTVAHRIRQRMDSLQRRKFIVFHKEGGHFRTWVRYTDQSPPPDDRRDQEEPRPLFAELDKQEAARVDFTVSSDDSTQRPGESLEMRPGDAPETRPVSRPEAARTDDHGSDAEIPEGGSLPGTADCPPLVCAHQTVRGAPNGAHQTVRGAPNGARDHQSEGGVGDGYSLGDGERSACASARLQENIYITTSSTTSELPSESARREERAPNGARLYETAYRLRSIDPSRLPWKTMLARARDAGQTLRLPGQERLGSHFRDLVLSAAILSVALPELGSEWIDGAADLASSEAKRSRKGLFFHALAKGLERGGLCARGEGYESLNELQFACGRCIAWLESQKPEAPAT